MVSKDTDTTSITAGESKLILSMIKHLKGDIQTDYDAVAQELGYKDASIARTRWGQIKRKWITADGGKASPKKRKGAATDGDDDEEEISTPPSKKRGRKPKAEKGKDGEAKEGEVKEEEVKEEEELVKEEVVDGNDAS
ncbi:hypothetical protein LTR62_000361 [Meristemomyces frigidus]|uniref:Myb-like DNA-binding domain-containing protein n=1 Tax=Meristemomyces frigidus TaxID=1508187 RepID=A0AAN7TTS0_9PEZI|nr:hypothetical protein LTR62_000361 [Meristemomyces frigidus]